MYIHIHTVSIIQYGHIYTPCLVFQVTIYAYAYTYTYIYSKEPKEPQRAPYPRRARLYDNRASTASSI